MVPVISRPLGSIEAEGCGRFAFDVSEFTIEIRSTLLDACAPDTASKGLEPVVTCCALLVCSNERSIGRTDVAVMCGELVAARDRVPLDNDVGE